LAWRSAIQIDGKWCWEEIIQHSKINKNIYRLASWEQVLIYNCNLAKIKQCDTNNNIELHML
jgi:nitrous oxidase accessory protein NosD